MSGRYRAEVTAIGGRTGRVLSADGALRLALAPPTAAAGRPAVNPEQLLAAGYAASFLQAIVDAARHRGIVLANDSNVTAAVERQADVHLDIGLAVDLPSVAPPVARQLVDEARSSCPFSVALRDHEVTVTVG